MTTCFPSNNPVPERVNVSPTLIGIVGDVTTVICVPSLDADKTGNSKFQFVPNVDHGRRFCASVSNTEYELKSEYDWRTLY